MIKLMLMSAMLLVALIPADLSQAADTPRSDFEQKLYEGVRATELLAAQVVSKSGLQLGQVRNVELSEDGEVTAVIAEQAGIGTIQEFVFRLPWRHVVKPIRRGRVVADLAEPQSNKFPLFPKLDTAQDAASTFLVSQVVGDYVRLQTGRGYGYVNDVVISADGRMLAVLVARGAPNRGTFAFPYPGHAGRWNAAMSYYGLPYVTDDQADEAGVKIDKKKFSAETG